MRSRPSSGGGLPTLGADETLVGIGGTIRNLAKIEMRRSEYPLPLLHGYVLTHARLREMSEDLAARKMSRRAHIAGLNPDRADTIVGGALIVQGVLDHVGAAEVMVSSRGLREGLALDRFGGEIPPAWWVRTISVATLASRFTTWSAAAGSRRAQLAAILHEARTPSPPTAIREMLGHAATVLDIGRAIDYYDRFEHAAMIVTSADLAGFSHADLGLLTAILRQADDDIRLGPYGRLVDAGPPDGRAAGRDDAGARRRAQPADAPRRRRRSCRAPCGPRGSRSSLRSLRAGALAGSRSGSGASSAAP